MSSAPPPRLLFLNRSYWPDTEATGQLLTELCEALTEQFQVTVLCGQPNQNLKQESFLASGHQVHQRVHIERVNHTRFAKRSLTGKLLNFCTFLWSAFWRSWRLERHDVVICETDPFLLPFLAVWIGLLSRCSLVFYLQDIYPDIAVAVGKARPGLTVGLLRRLLRWCYRRASAIVVLSEDMRTTIREWGSLEKVPIHVIPNWVDTTVIHPVKAGNAWRRKQGLSDQFVIMYSGNLGLSQELSIVLDTAEQLQHQTDVTFLFVGDGASKCQLRQATSDRGLANVRFLPYQPRELLMESLSAADLQLLPIRAEALKSLMPSKLYGILASGTAVLSTAPPESELGRVVEQSGAGVNIHPYTSENLLEAVRTLLANRGQLHKMGQQGRHFAEQKYDLKLSIQKFVNLLQDVCAHRFPSDLSDETDRTENRQTEG